MCNPLFICMVFQWKRICERSWRPTVLFAVIYMSLFEIRIKLLYMYFCHSEKNNCSIFRVDASSTFWKNTKKCYWIVSLFFACWRFTFSHFNDINVGLFFAPLLKSTLWQNIEAKRAEIKTSRGVSLRSHTGIIFFFRATEQKLPPKVNRISRMQEHTECEREKQGMRGKKDQVLEKYI